MSYFPSLHQSTDPAPFYCSCWRSERLKRGSYRTSLLISSILPIFAWPVDFLARFLGFAFLYNTGVGLLRAGFESRRTAAKVQTLLATLLITSAFDLIPAFLFDSTHHFGALDGFFVPAILSTTPKPNGPTIAKMISDIAFKQAGEVIDSVIPAQFKKGADRRATLLIMGIILGTLL